MRLTLAVVGLPRIERGPRDAEIRGQPGNEQALKLAGLEIGGKSGCRFAIGFGVSRVAIDVLVKSLSNDERGLRNREIFRKRGAIGSLHAVIGPQHLLAVFEFDSGRRAGVKVRCRRRIESSLLAAW
jgi:hypothetical protein